MADTGDLLAAARKTIQLEAAAIASLSEQLDESLAAVIDALLHCEGHVLVSGIGTSHAIARRFAHLLSCSGIPALCLDAGDSLHGGSGAIRAQDLLFVISKGGRSGEINKLVRIAQQRGAMIIAQTETLDSPLSEMADIVWLISSPSEVDPLGMIATGSSLVNAAAGDVLCALLFRLRDYSRAEFGATHPGGAVGDRLASESCEETY